MYTFQFVKSPRLKCLVAMVMVLWFRDLSQAQNLIDTEATPKTKALYANLARLSQHGFLFGHQDDDAYGVGWERVEGRSDVKEVCGSFPAVHGWDLGKLGRSHNLDSVKFSDVHRWIKQVYSRGGVNTISWHVDNPVSKKSAWDKTPAVRDILPGGNQHEFFLAQLDLVAQFLNACEADASTKIPIIFRPFHEHNGDWFWWGKGNCTEEEYVKLWKFTVDYLKDKKHLHHLIYAFSPDRSRMNLADAKTSYQYAYPGDGYVDILGLDNYMDVGATWNKKSPDEKRADFISSLQTVTRLAKEKNKVAALTETGQAGLANSSWFTEIILDPIKKNPDIKIAYMLVWRNADEKQYFAPYPGQQTAADFVKFYQDPMTIFESDLKDIYK